MTRALILTALLAACTSSESPSAERFVLAEDATAEEVSRLSQNIDATRARVDASPSSWAIRSELAGLYQTRARLTGDWDDYGLAQDQLDAAYAWSGDAGPHLQQASLDYTLHRLSAIEPRLVDYEDRILIDDQQRATLLHRRAQVDLLTDGYVDAGEQLNASIDEYETLGAHADLARLAWVIGDYDTAHDEYERSEALYFGVSDEPRAWFHLQRGLMDLDRGRFDDALVHYQDADAAMPGYWLVHEHIAEVLWELGELEAADDLYASVTASHPYPDLLDTYAEFLAAQGQDEASQELYDQARPLWESRIERFPDAAYGHGIGHYLATDPDRAVELAEEQLIEQPSASARTVYAEALLGVDRAEDARTAIDAALATEWRHADTFAMGSQVYAALGDDAMASELCSDARDINPSADCGE